MGVKIYFNIERTKRDNTSFSMIKEKLKESDVIVTMLPTKAPEQQEEEVEKDHKELKEPQQPNQPRQNKPQLNKLNND